MLPLANDSITSSSQQIMEYRQRIQAKFSNIFIEFHDESFQSNPSKKIRTLASKIKHSKSLKQQILFQRYPLLKRGKNFSTLQERTFKVDNQKIYQVDKNGHERQLPFPISVNLQHRQSQADWTLKDYEYRLVLEFNERSPIQIYFDQKTNCEQVMVFLIWKSRPDFGKTLQACSSRYKEKLNIDMKNLLQQSKNSNSLYLLKKNRQIIKQNIKEAIIKKYNNQNAIKFVIYEWARKARSVHQKQNVLYSKISKLKIQIKMFQIFHKKQQDEDGNEYNNLKSIEVKLWIDSKTHDKNIILNHQSLQEKPPNLHYFTKKETAKFYHIHQYSVVHNNLHENYFIIEDMLTINNSIQFQVQITNMNTQNKNNTTETWKSQRFLLKDWIIKQNSIGKGPKVVMLYCQSRTIYMKVQTPLFVTHIRNNKKNAQYLQNNSDLNPIDYPIIRQLVPNKTIIKKIKQYKQKIIEISDQYNMKRNDVQSMHSQVLYSRIKAQYQDLQATNIMSFRIFLQLYHQLDIPALVDKFFINYPFNQFINIHHPGTFIYSYLVKAEHLSNKIGMSNKIRSLNSNPNNSQPLYYHDVEKLIWKFNKPSMRPFLSALKAFDEIPRINFTQPFYELCRKCLQITHADIAQSYNDEKNYRYDHFFQNSTIGRQSMAFFLVLALLKQGSSLLLYQSCKRSLSKTTLLFHYILKMQFSQIYSRILKTQINIESFFGIQLTSLLASLFDIQFFSIILDKFLKEKRNRENVKQPYHITFISAFLAVISLADQSHKNGCLYQSAQHYHRFIKIYSKNQYLSQRINQFMMSFQNNYILCEQYINNQQYIKLQNNMQQFYERSQFTVIQEENPHNTSISQLTMGQILQKLYNSFTCYKHKNQNDIRKIFITIDNVILRSSLPIIQEKKKNKIQNNDKRLIKSLVIAIYQGNNKLYYHQLVNIEGHNHKYDIQGYYGYWALSHNIQIKLVRLDKLQIIIYQKINNISQNTQFRCSLNPSQLPSNYYLQQNIGLYAQTRSKQNIGKQKVDLYRGASIKMQVYIKDSCEVQFIENAIPEQYISNFLLKKPHIVLNQNSFNESQVYSQQSRQIKKYKNDIIFCNHFFQSYRMPENNFNLLYSKLGWYGNHYLIPDERLLNILKINNSKIVRQQQGINIQMFDTKIQPLSQSDSQRIYTILFYSRCLYGRGIIPKINFGYINSDHFLISSQILSNYYSQEFQSYSSSVCKSQRYDFNPQDQSIWYKSTNKTIGYLLNNFTGPTSNFISYYWKMTKQLPLIRYLGFRTRQFYILSDLKFDIECKIPLNIHTNKNLINNFNKQQQSSYSQIHGNRLTNFVKNKILSSSKALPQLQRIMKECENYYMVASFEVFFTNGSSSKRLSQKVRHPFLGFKDFSKNQAVQLRQVFNNYIQLCPNLQYINTLFIFEYPKTKLYFDEFLYLSRLNIAKHYLINQIANINKPNIQSPTKLTKKQAEKRNTMNYFIRPKQCIPNMFTSDLFQIILQTQYVFKLHIGHQPQYKQNFHKLQNMHRKRTEIESEMCRFDNWAFMDHRWKKVSILGYVKSPSYTLSLVEQQLSLKKSLVQFSSLILSEQKIYNKKQGEEKYMFKKRVWNFTDKQVFNLQKCLKDKLLRYEML